MIITKTNKLLLAGLAIVIIGGGGGGYIYTRNNDQPADSNKTASNIDYSPGTKADNASNESAKDGPTQPSTGDNPSESTSNVTAQITGANVQADNVHIGTFVSGTSTGKCALSATKGDTTVQLGSSTVAQSVNVYSCGVFNIPPKSFPSSGTWQLTLSVTSDAGTAKGTYSVSIP